MKWLVFLLALATSAFGQTIASPVQVTSNTAVLNGANVWTGTNQFGTLAGAANIQNILGVQGGLSFTAPSANSCVNSSTNLTLTGAQLSNAIFLGVPNGAISAGAIFMAWVSATNTVTVRYCCANGASACASISSQTFTVVAFQ